MIHIWIIYISFFFSWILSTLKKYYHDICSCVEEQAQTLTCTFFSRKLDQGLSGEKKIPGFKKQTNSILFFEAYINIC